MDLEYRYFLGGFIAFVVLLLVFITFPMPELIGGFIKLKENIGKTINILANFIFKYVEYIIVSIGTILFCLRIVFPVLSVDVYHRYIYPHVLFFSFGPKDNYLIHPFRTYSQAFVIFVLTVVLCCIVYNIKKYRKQ